MMTPEKFSELASKGFNRITMVRSILADLETPLGIYLKVGRGTHSYFFESVHGGEKWGRYSIIGLPCKTLLRVVANKVTIETDGLVTETIETDDPFEAVSEFKSRYRVADLDDLHRFCGGLVGYFCYDTVRYLESSLGPCNAEDEIGSPDVLLMVSEEVIVFDNLRETMSIVINVDPGQEDAFENGLRRLDYLEEQLHIPSALPQFSAPQPVDEKDFHFSFGKENFEQSVDKIKDYIVAGDVMQVVLSQRMSIPYEGDPLNIYRALRYLNPSPYMVFFDMDDHHVVSASPEVLARVDGERITVRPLAGTRPRGETEEKDRELEIELLADEKELAEHLMLIDLSRNDAGRVSKIGSVDVTKKMFVERYSHVMHIASNVESLKLDDKSELDVLQSTLPVGTLSGAPKVRAMQIIDELEPVKRGIYGGAMGYLAWDGNMDMAIAIRTAVITKGKLFVQAGAGIVADSQPSMEWDETINKARAIVRALQLAETRFKDLD